MTEDEILIWHDDGHNISLMLNRNLLLIDKILCPAGGKEGSACYSKAVNGCIVDWFLNQYGLECNVGIIEPTPVIEIAWTVSGEWEVDVDLAQVWVIPREDSVFYAWAQAQKGD